MNPVLKKLLAGGPVLTDGAWGTQLQTRGLRLGEFPDTWNVTHADEVAAVARSYVDAGSRVILTNTFGSNAVRLREPGVAKEARALNRAGVEISKRAAGTDVLVFASIGPSGKMLLAGEVTPDELHAAFSEQAVALAEGGADALVVETMTDLDEAKIAVAAAATTGLPTVACMVFDSGRHKDRTMMGVTPEQAATALHEAGAEMVGANCGQGIEGFLPICQRLKTASQRPVWIKANAGLPSVESGKAVYHTSAEQFASFARSLEKAGAAFIGGCCGTDPSFIAALAKTFAKEARP